MTIPLEIARPELSKRIRDVLIAHLPTELELIERDEVPGLQIEPPNRDAYFMLRSERRIRSHRPGHVVCVYIHPFDEIDPVTNQSTGGNLRRIIRYDIEWAVTVRIAEQAGDIEFSDPDECLDTMERDGARMDYYLGAIESVMYAHGRDGRAITLVKKSRTVPDLDLNDDADQPELFGRLVFDITQRCLAKQDNN